MVDRTHGGSVQGAWIAGEAHSIKFFGMNTGGITIDDNQVHPVTCYRCTACFFLESYAYPLPTEAAETMLLRPAQGTTPEDAQQLLRGSSADE